LEKKKKQQQKNTPKKLARRGLWLPAYGLTEDVPFPMELASSNQIPP